MPPSQRARGTGWHTRAARVILASGLLLASCSDDGDTTALDGGPGALDGGPVAIDAGSCEQKQATFSAFLLAHNSCTVDADCTVVGDCCPHADFPVVRSDALGQARALQLGTCGGACDGPTYTAVCSQGKCDKTANPSESWCGARRSRDGGR
ncbi:MAG: hypothetical protein JWN04_4314 [Myxococcaceae bacterium]|nr:hypothetical protein [Myxococcaceae bacterium]